MTRHIWMPLAMGAAMGLMMLWMLHMQLTTQSARSLGALAIFVGAHVALLAVALALPCIASPRLRRSLAHLHRPSLSHIALMIAAAISAAAIAHFAVHFGGS